MTLTRDQRTGCRRKKGQGRTLPQIRQGSAADTHLMTVLRKGSVTHQGSACEAAQGIHRKVLVIEVAKTGTANLLRGIGTRVVMQDTTAPCTEQTHQTTGLTDLIVKVVKAGIRSIAQLSTGTDQLAGVMMIIREITDLEYQQSVKTASVLMPGLLIVMNLNPGSLT